MSTTASRNPDQIVGIRISDDRLRVDLRDGTILSVPLTRYPALMHASIEQRNNFDVIDAGRGLRWPDLDEDITVDGMLLCETLPGDH